MHGGPQGPSVCPITSETSLKGAEPRAVGGQCPPLTRGGKGLDPVPRPLPLCRQGAPWGGLELISINPLPTRSFLVPRPGFPLNLSEPEALEDGRVYCLGA